MGTIRLNINSETAITEKNVPAQSWNSQRMKKEKTKNNDIKYCSRELDSYKDKHESLW